MRRSLILGLSTAITTAAVTLLAASPAAPIVICPVAGGAQASVTTCCGPPTAQAMRSDFTPIQPCCPGSAMCARLLTIGSAPNPSNSTQKVVISGTASGASVAPGATVTIWQRLPGESQFSKLADVMPDSSGSYSLTESPTTNRQWYATANGLRSITVQQQVRAVVTLTASVDRGGTYAFHARVSPSHAGQRIMLEMRSGKRWTMIVGLRLDRTSRGATNAAFSFARPIRGRHLTFRATFLGDSRNVRSSSRTITLPAR